MKKNAIAILALASILFSVCTLNVNMISARALASVYESLVKVTKVTNGPGNISSAGSTALFTLTFEFPALYDDESAPGAGGGGAGQGFYDDSSLTYSQIRDLEISMGPGSAFSFNSGELRIKPFATVDSSALQDKTNHVVTLVYKGGGNNLELVFSHPTKVMGAGGVPETVTATSTWSFFIKETVYTPAPEPAPYEPPDTSVTPRLTLSGDLPRLDAGKSGNITLSLSNKSQYNATNVVVTLEETSESIFRPMTIQGYSVSVGAMRVNDLRSITIPVEVFDDAKEGYYTVTLSVSLTNSYGVAFEQRSNIQVFIVNPQPPEDTGKPLLSMVSATVDTNTPASDGGVNLTLAIANIGDAAASDVRVSLTGFRNAEITLNESVVTKALGSIEPGERSNAVYSLRVAEELEAGSYPLNVEIRHRLRDGTETTISDVAYVNIIRQKNPDEPDGPHGMVQLAGIGQSASDPGGSNVVDITLSVRNNGDAAAQDVSIGLSGLSASSFTLSGGFGDRLLGIIAPGEVVTATFALYVSENLPNGNHPLAVHIDYYDTGESDPQKKTVEAEVYILINRPEKEKEPDKEPDKEPEPDRSVPRVIISKHSISADTVIAGSPFELSVTLLNTSAQKNVKNLKVTVTDIDGIFIPVEGVNSFYIPQIPIGGTTDISIILMPKQDAETKSYPVTISLDYEDEKDTSYTVSESLSIPVYLPQRLEVMNVIFTEDGMGTAYLSFQFINKGKAPLYNMNIRIDGPMSARDGDYYIGTFGAGQADYFEDTIMPQEFGDVSGYIVLEYEDSSGMQQEMRHSIFTYISEPYMGDPGFPGGEWPLDPGWPGGEGFEEEGGGLKGWMIWSIIGGAVLICAITVIIIVKKVKNKKIELEDYE